MLHDGEGAGAAGASHDRDEVLHPLIAPAAIRMVREAIEVAEASGALDRPGRWSRHLAKLLPLDEELRGLEELTSSTLSGAADARAALGRRLAGLAHRFRVPRAIAPRDRAREVGDEPHDHDRGPIDVRTALALRLAATITTPEDDSAGRRNDLAVEGLLARVSMIAALAPLAAAALVDRGAFAPFIAALHGFDDGPLGPDGGLLPWPQKPFIDPRILICIGRANIALQPGGVAFPTLGYHLQTIDLPWSCPGARVVLTGVRFGNQAGRVMFKGSGGPMSVVMATVDPADWTDTRIAVDIPAKASAGAVTLRLPGDIPRIPLCGHSFYVPPITRSDVVYRGGAGAVDDLRLRPGTPSPLGAGAPLTLEWRARPEGAYVVLWIDDAAHNRLVDAGGLAATGTYTWAPPAGVAATYTVTLWAHHCGTWGSRSIDLHVEVDHQIAVRAVEVTQVVQFLGAAGLSGGGDDNSIPMVRGKPTMVRVYLETNQGSALTTQEPYVDLYGYDQDGNLLAPSPLTATARRVLPSTTPLGNVAALDDDLRDHIDASVNFVLPATWLFQDPPLGRNWSTLRLEAVAGAFGDVDVDPARASATTTVRIYACTPLRVVLVRVQLVGPGQNLLAPSSAVARDTLQGARHMLPSPYLEVVDDVAWAFPLPPFGASMDPHLDLIWGLLQDFATQRDDDADVIYCAVLPSQTPLGNVAGVGDESPSARGCAVFTATALPTAAHEIGHACGLSHSWDDGSYPAYADGVAQTVQSEAADGTQVTSISDRNGLGQWGVAAERSFYDDGHAAPVFRPSTVATLAASGPRPAGDIMSSRHMLGHERWPSPHNYRSLMGIFDGIGVSAVGVPSVLRMARAAGHKPMTAFVSGVIRAGGGEVGDVVAHHVRAWPHASLRSRELTRREEVRLVAGDAADAPLWLAALGDGGTVVASAIIEPRRDRERGLAFHAAIELADNARRLSLRRGARELWGADRGPTPDVEHVTVDRDGERVILRWRASGAKAYAVAVSFDDGRTWRRRTGWIAEPTWSTTLAELGRGGPVTFRILAHDGALATGEGIATHPLPRRPGSIVPTFALDDGGMRRPAGQRVGLAVMALESDGTSRDEAVHAALRWRSDRQGELGTGRTIDAIFAAGEHTVTVASDDGDELVIRVTATASR